MTVSPSRSFYSEVDFRNEIFFQCPFCPKAFVHESYCLSHIQRRHPEHDMRSYIRSAPVSPTGHLMAPSHVIDHHNIQHSHVTQVSVQSHLERELVELKERLQATEHQLREAESAKSQVCGWSKSLVISLLSFEANLKLFAQQREE